MSNFNSSYRSFNNRQWIAKIFHVNANQKNVDSTQINNDTFLMFVDYYDNNKYLNNEFFSINQSNNENTNNVDNHESSSNSSIINFLNIFVSKFICWRYVKKFLFNNKLHNHVRQRTCLQKFLYKKIFRKSINFTFEISNFFRKLSFDNILIHHVKSI